MGNGFTPYFLVLPTVLVILAVAIYPILYSLWLSLLDNPLSPSVNFVGLSNYVRLFASSDFRSSIGTTFAFTIIALLFRTLASLGVFDLLPERKVESAVTWMRSHPEIQAQGFPGKIRTVYRFIRTLRQEPAELPAPFVLDRVSVQEAIWLIARPESNLEADERTDLQELCQASSNQSGYIPSFDRKLKRLPL